MNRQTARIALGALCVVLGIWVGARVHHSRTPVLTQHWVKVSAGLASAPNPADLAPVVEGGLQSAAKIPDRLPPFSLADSSGKDTSIGSFADKSLIINFWATWCAPCRSEIPLLETLHAEWAGRGMSVVGIAVDQPDKVREFAARFKIGYPLLVGEQDALDAAAALGVTTPVFPFTVFTDRRGEVVALYIGELHKAQAELILSEVQSLDQGTKQLPAARAAITAGLSALQPST